MLLQRTEVVHLGSTSEIQRNLTSVTALSTQTSSSADACVVAAKSNSCQQRVRVAFANTVVFANLPRLIAKFVDREVAHASRLRSASIKHRHH